MIEHVMRGDFKARFRDFGNPNNFSYDALNVLFDYYEELEKSTGEVIELDVMNICCDWTEYQTEASLLNDYAYESLDEIRKETTVLDVPGRGFLVLGELTNGYI